MWMQILNFILEYLIYFIGGFIQILFILLPVTLKNWEDDILNALTYIAFQEFIAGVTFIIIPWFLEVIPISFWTQVLLLGITCLIALFRVIQLVPFEFTYPIKLRVLHAKSLVFDGFYTAERHSVLSTFDFQDQDSLLRYNAFREKLIRSKSERSSSALEEMIRDGD